MEQKLEVNAGELKEGEVSMAKIGESAVAVIKYKGEISVLDGKCTHEGGPLQEGYLDNDEIICPWHSGAFNVKTGKVSENTPWATADVRSYKVRIDGSAIYVEV